MVNRYLDVETKGLNAREFVLGCIVDDDGKERYFYTSDDMREWIIEDVNKQIKYKKRVFYYAHNHQYDFYAVWKDHLWDEHMKIYRNDPLFAVYKDKGYFIDSMSFFRGSLAKLGESVSLEKMDIPESLLTGDDINLEEIKPYCLRDVLIVKRAMENFRESLNELGFKPRFYISAGQVGMTTFQTYVRKNGLQWSLGHLVPSEDNPKQKRFKFYQTINEDYVRASFRGGRCQAFKTGYFDNMYNYDINSQHPYVETIMRFPNLKTEKLINYPPSDVFQKTGVSKATLLSPKPCVLPLAYLPIYWDGKQIYPHDCEMTGVWTNLELKKALELGYKLVDIEFSVVYEDSDINPLREYQLLLWNIRKNNPNLKMAVKLLQNSFGMKFAQRNEDKDVILINRYEYPSYHSKGYRFSGSMDNKFIVTLDKGVQYPAYYAPIVSSLITANARDMLYDAMRKIPYSKLLYCDTDSIICKGNVNKYLNVGKELGQWKPVNKGENGKILGEKRYYIGDNVKISGLMTRERDKALLDFEMDAHVKRMITVKDKFQGSMEKIGTFRDMVIQVRSGSKSDVAYPNSITETYV